MDLAKLFRKNKNTGGDSGNGDAGNKAAMQGLGNIASGVAGMVSNVSGLTKVNDQQYKSYLNNSYANYNAGSYDQLAGQMDATGSLNTNYNTGLSGKEKAKGIAGAAMSGAQAGSAFGPWGALIGAAAGGIAGGVGAIVGQNKAKDAREELAKQAERVQQYNSNSLINNSYNISQGMNSNLNTNYFADGGPIVGTSAVEEALRRKGIAVKEPVKPAQFSRGGTTGNGTHFSNGLVTINSGGTHETNPNDGVPLGVDSNGTPNLVEEGETVYKVLGLQTTNPDGSPTDPNSRTEYVFSNRLRPSEDFVEKYNLSPKDTVASASKKLARESEEMPNDPITKATLDAMMLELANDQEKTKAEQGSIETMADMGDEELIAAIQDSLQGGGESPEEPAPAEQAPADPMAMMGGMPMMAHGGTIARKYSGDDPEASSVMPKIEFPNLYSNWNTASLNLPDEMRTHYNNNPNASFVDSNGNAFDPYKYNQSEHNVTFSQGNDGKGLFTITNKPIGSRNYIDYGDENAQLIRGNVNDYILNNKLQQSRKSHALNGVMHNYYSPNEGGELEPDPWWPTLAAASNPIIAGFNYARAFRPADYSNADYIKNAALKAGEYDRIKAEPTADYMKRTPIDLNYIVNTIGGNRSATDRALMASSGLGHRTAATAAMLANRAKSSADIGNTIAESAKLAMEDQKNVVGHNAAINMKNAENALAAAKANQDTREHAKQVSLSGIATALALRDKIRQHRDAEIAFYGPEFAKQWDAYGDRQLGKRWAGYNRDNKVYDTLAYAEQDNKKIP